MNLTKEKNVTISISIPEWMNDFLTKAVESHNKNNPQNKISKSFLISVIVDNAITENHIAMENAKNENKA